MIKALSNSSASHQELIRALPEVYRLRNRAIHGDVVPTAEDVNDALKALDEALSALTQVPSAVLGLALRASERGVRGTRLPSRVEEAQKNRCCPRHAG